MQPLREWGLEGYIIEVKENKFRYAYDLGVIDFIFLSKDTSRFFEMHDEIWCENETEFFLAIFEDREIHICDSKTKPNHEHPIENASIDSFWYGENTLKARKYLQLFKKENIDTGECIKEIQRSLKKRKRMRVDEDLVENLKSQKNRIINLLGNRKNKEEIAQKMIDRCLFIRSLEDRAGRNDLKNILNRANLDDLLDLFDFYSRNLNGDVFEEGDIPRDIDSAVIKELEHVFGVMYIRSDLQKTLTPYCFKSIPIILISNIYEKFLSKKEKNNEGIVFTPENVVDYMIDKILKDGQTAHKIKEGKIRVLDPACGSGVFLVKFLEKIFEGIEKEVGESLLRKKAYIVENCLYGVDKNDNALRIAALSLYLKIIEDENPEVINREFFNKNEEHFMFPGLKKNKNLVNGDSLFDDLFGGEKFDIIVGNPPWGLGFKDEEKKIVGKKWKNASDYQSSQYFLFKIEEWMKKGTICAMIVNLSNFTNLRAEKFRKDLITRYSMKFFTNLSRIKNITFGEESEPACILFFTSSNNDMVSNTVNFSTPGSSYFSDLTYIISDDNKSEVPISKLKENDNLWHIYALGYDKYIGLVEFLDGGKCNYLGDFKKEFKEGIGEKKDPRMDKKEFNAKYRAFSRINENYYPIIDSLTGVSPYFGKEKKEYLLYGPHLKRPKYLGLFEGKKLIITRSWPTKAFIDFDTTLFDTNFWIFKLKDDYPEKYLLFFESLINSELAHFYLGVKHHLREKGKYPKTNKQRIAQFPIPDLKNKKDIVDEIIKTVQLLESLGSCKNSSYRKLQDDINGMIFDLYGLDYYDIKEIEHYKIERGRENTAVKDKDIQNYCREFADTFKPFIKEELFLNPKWGTSEFFGTIVKFGISEYRTPICYDKELERFVHIIENQEIEYGRKDVFKERKIKFYDDDELYIYKSNKLKDWTEFMAIRDANEELGIFFQKIGGE